MQNIKREHDDHTKYEFIYTTNEFNWWKIKDNRLEINMDTDNKHA